MVFNPSFFKRNNTNKPKRVVILGGGPTGLSVAWQLTNLGHQVTVLEKSGHLGGLCRTMNDNGYHFDFGPHNIHTHRQDIIEFFKRILGDNLVSKSFKVKIFFNDQLVDYPIKGLNALKVLSVPQKICAVFDLVLARILMFMRNPKEDGSFKDWITHRFGRTLYKIYFGPYAEKVWKTPANEISAYVAAKRVPIISLTDYIRKLFRREQKQFHKEFGPTVQSFYPKYGIGQVVDFFIEELSKTNCRIVTDSTITALHREGNAVTHVAFTQDDKERKLDADFLISTIPLNELVKLFQSSAPEDVLEAGRALEYCPEKLLFIKTNKEKIFDVPLVYFQNPKIKFNRVYDVRVFSPECVPAGKNALCFEFTCAKDDDIWNATDSELFDLAMNVFEKKNLLHRNEVDGYFSKQVTHAYPKFRKGFQKNLQTIFAFLSGFTNALTLGRQGLFCYANVDEVLSMGFRVIDYVHTLQYKSVDYYSLFEEFLHEE